MAQNVTPRLRALAGSAFWQQAARLPQAANKTPVARGAWAVPKPTAARVSRKSAVLQGGQDGTAGCKMQSSPGLVAVTVDAAAAESAAGSLAGVHVRQGAASRGLVLRRGMKLPDVPRRAGMISSSSRRKQESSDHQHTIIAKKYHYDPPVRSLHDCFCPQSAALGHLSLLQDS